MTKKEQILQATLELFSQHGYNSTSTNKISKQAGVSEGLIFSHFTNKVGLAKAILEDAELKSGYIFRPIFESNEPKDTLKKAITQIFTIPKSEYSYWMLIAKLKWELGYNQPEKYIPYFEKLTSAFAALGYENPEREAQVLWKIQEGIINEIIKGNTKQEAPLKEFLLKKYNLK